MRTKGPKRCLFVWYDKNGWHQCEHQRTVPTHFEEKRGYPGIVAQPRDKLGKRCLGIEHAVWTEGAYGQPVPASGGQCKEPRETCKVIHAFYAKTRLDKETT